VNRRGGLVLAGVVGAVVIAVIVVLVLLLTSGGEPGASVQPSPSTPAVSASPSAEPTINEALLSQRLTVLVIGTDVNAGRASRNEPMNTDSLILASIDADQSEVTLISIPRDTADVPLPDGSTWQRKINAIERERDVETLVGAVGELTGAEIDSYVQVDMDDLRSLVDAVGGVDVEVEEPLHDPKVGLDISAGSHHLDGAQALSYVRTRVDTDFGRAQRQQEVLLALVAGLVSPDTDLDLASLLSGLDSLQTDLPLDDLMTLRELGRRAQSANVTRQVLKPPEFISFAGDRHDGRGYVLIPDLEAIRSYVAEQLAD
jgi:LCP family protein required for cell wall assembly